MIILCEQSKAILNAAELFKNIKIILKFNTYFGS